MPATSDLSSAPKPKSGTNNASRAPRLRRDGPIPVADGYLLRSVIEASLRGLTWFAGLFLAFAIVTSARRIAQDDLPLVLVVQLIGVQMPRIVLFTIPASLLFGTVSTFTEMSSKGEITALMAGGMSLWRMLRGPVFFAFLMGVFAFVLQEVIVPGAESRKDTIVKTAAQHITIQEGFKIVESRPDGSIKRIVQANSFNPSSKTLDQPVVQFLRPDKTMEMEIQAESARWDNIKKRWVLVNGEARFKPQSKPGSTPEGQAGNATYDQRTQFSEWVLETDAALTPSQMTVKSITTQDRLANHNYEMVSLKQLSKYRTRLNSDYQRTTGQVQKNTEKEIRAVTFGIHDKFATPLVCIAMILIGAPLGIRPQRSASSGLAMGLSLLVMMTYYIVWTLATSWGKGGFPYPQFVAYIPFLLTAGIGFVMVARKS